MPREKKSLYSCFMWVWGEYGGEYMCSICRTLFCFTNAIVSSHLCLKHGNKLSFLLKCIYWLFIKYLLGGRGDVKIQGRIGDIHSDQSEEFRAQTIAPLIKCCLAFALFQASPRTGDIVFKKYGFSWSLQYIILDYIWGVCIYAQLLSHVQLFEVPWTVACQASLSMWFSRQEYWSGLPFPPLGDLPYSGIELAVYCISRQVLHHWRHPPRKTRLYVVNSTKEDYQSTRQI